MNISNNIATSLRQNEVLEPAGTVSASSRPALYLVAETVAPQVKAPRATPFRLRSYLPNVYLSQSRGSRAGSYV